jgi:hypothetical protein
MKRVSAILKGKIAKIKAIYPTKIIRKTAPIKTTKSMAKTI